MPAHVNTRPQAEMPANVVTAPTLKEAHRRVRARFGDDAVILDTRTVAERQPGGLGEVRRVEITVQDGTTPPRTLRAPAPAPATASPDELVHEVERIEALVAAVVSEYGAGRDGAAWLGGNPVAEALVAAGASPSVVRDLVTRGTAEKAAAPDDRAAWLEWLGGQLAASGSDWDGFLGCHAFLGHSGAGRTDLVLASARRLQKLDRRTLVLSVLPAHGGEIRRLQSEAAEIGFDAAVIKRADQLPATDRHLSGYDAVLLDLPRIDHPDLRPDGPVHGWLASHEGFHRHLLVPADRDPAEAAELGTDARLWNCDWLAVTRLDCTRRAGKLLDFLAEAPLPVSLLGGDPLAGGELEIANSGRLLDLVLGATDGRRALAAAGGAA